MKNLQWLINAVLLIGLIYLIVNNVSEESPEPEKQKITAEKDTNDQAFAGLNVRYINSDTVFAKYELVNELRTSLEAKQRSYQNDLEQKLKSFEEEVMAFQTEAGNMSGFAAQQEQKRLVEKEQELAMLQQNLSERLQGQELKMQKQLREKLQVVLDAFKSEKIDLILDYSINSSILYANDSLDITSLVIDSLNTQHNRSKK